MAKVLGIVLGLATLMSAATTSRFAGAAQKVSRVTEVSLRAANERPGGACPIMIRFSGHITMDGPGTVTYTFTRSDGASGPTQTLEFKEAGTQPLSTTWTLGDAQATAPYEGWLAVRVLSPNELESSREAGRFVLTCGAARTDSEKGAEGIAAKGIDELTGAAEKKEKAAAGPEKVAPGGLAQTGAENTANLKGSSVSPAGASAGQPNVLPRNPSYATSGNLNATRPTIYMADPGGGRVSAMQDLAGAVLGELHRPPAGTFAARAGDSFSAPEAVAVDGAGRIYVGDGRRIVRVDDISGANWRSLGGFHSVSGIFVDSAYRIYVADVKGSVIVRIDDMDGRGRVTLRGRGGQRLLLPTSVTVDDAGRIYITDTGHHRIVRVDDMTGAGWVACCGPPPDPKTGLVQDTEQLLSFPRGIALDARRRIYVTTTPTFRPLFDAEGTPAYEIAVNPGGPEVPHYSVTRIDDMTGAGRLSYSRQRPAWVRETRDGVNQFAYPTAIALDGAGRIYITDFENMRLTRTDDLTGAGWVTFRPSYCDLCTPRSVAVSDVARPRALPPPEDLSPLVYITSAPGPRDAPSSPLSFDLFSPVVRAIISEDVELRSVSVQLDDGPLMPMPFSRDPEGRTLYHGQLREVRPSRPDAPGRPGVLTLRVVATDTAGQTSEDRRQFRRH